MSEVTEETPDVVEEPDEEPVEEEGTEEDIPFEEPEEQAEPEPEPPAAHGRSERELEAIRKKLDTSANTWRRRVEELLGEDFAALTPCELCGDDIPGFHWPAELLQPDNEIQERLLAVLRQPAVMTYNPDPDTRECDRCSGKGKLELPGIVPGNETKVCGQCKGYGYIPSEANMLLIDGKRPGKETAQAMLEHKVAIGRSWPSMPNHVRVTIGTRDEMAKFKKAFERVMEA